MAQPSGFDVMYGQAVHNGQTVFVDIERLFRRPAGRSGDAIARPSGTYRPDAIHGKNDMNSTQPVYLHYVDGCFLKAGIRLKIGTVPTCHTERVPGGRGRVKRNEGERAVVRGGGTARLRAAR